MIKLKSILLEQANPKLLGFAKAVVGTIMAALSPEWEEDGHFTYKATNRGKMIKAIDKIKTQEQYDAVLDLCKTSKVLKQKYPMEFPFYTIMELIQLGYDTQSKDPDIFGVTDTSPGSDAWNLKIFESKLQRFNPDEKIIRK